MSYMQQQAFEHTERKQNIKRFPNCFFKREKMITMESTTCYTFQGQNFLNRVKILSQVCCCLDLFCVISQMIEKLNTQLRIPLLCSFPPTHVFAASCSHRDSTTKIQEARATGLAERESSKIATTGKTKSS